MIVDGLFGTRADLFVDLSLIYFVGVPFVMLYSIRSAGKGAHRLHRGFQFVLLLLMIFFILVLELSIQLGDTKLALAKSEYADTTMLSNIFIFHLFVALCTFVSWIALSFASWNRFLGILPGSYSFTHKLWGAGTYIGLCVTSATGLVLYILGFAL